jgi:hypothetical protein
MMPRSLQLPGFRVAPSVLRESRELFVFGDAAINLATFKVLAA